MRLPDGLASRPLEPADARAVFELIAAEELLDVGEVVTEEADVVADWQRPSLDLATSTVGVLDGGRLVAYAELSTDYSGGAAVHPDHRGRGLGTALAGWVRSLAEERGLEVVGMPVPAGSPGDRLLASLGWFVRWESWVLRLPEGAAVETQPLPPGHHIRTATSKEELRAFHDVVEDAFLEWAEREREPFEDFLAQSVRRPGFEPWHLRLLVDPDGAAVGACYTQLSGNTGYVDTLAVRRDRRGEGLARALLADAFGNARRHGATVSELATDSRTGALGLYRRVGMEVVQTWVHRAVRLNPA